MICRFYSRPEGVTIDRRQGNVDQPWRVVSGFVEFPDRDVFFTAADTGPNRYPHREHSTMTTAAVYDRLTDEGFSNLLRGWPKPAQPDWVKAYERPLPSRAAAGR
jgi:hypothetical protein